MTNLERWIKDHPEALKDIVNLICTYHGEKHWDSSCEKCPWYEKEECHNVKKAIEWCKRNNELDNLRNRISESLKEEQKS